MTSYDVQICYIHRDDPPQPIVFMHEHHRTPRAFGGTDEGGNLVWLCVGCHDLLHRLATLTMSGKKGLAEDYLEQYLSTDLRARELLKELVQEVIQARLQFDEKALEAEDEKTVQLKIPVTLHSMLKTLAGDFSKRNGRPMGLYAFMQAGLKQFAMSQMFGTELKTLNAGEAPDVKALYDLKTGKSLNVGKGFKRFGT